MPLTTPHWCVRLLTQCHMLSQSLLTATHCLVIGAIVMNEPDIVLAFKHLTIYVRKIAIMNFK